MIKGLRFTTKKEGPGRGWWGPPKGTHERGTREGSIGPKYDKSLTNDNINIFLKNNPSTKPRYVKVSADLKKDVLEITNQWKEDKGADWKSMQRFLRGDKAAPVILDVVSQHQMYIQDGHHRIAATLLSGSDKVLAYVNMY